MRRTSRALIALAVAAALAACGGTSSSSPTSGSTIVLPAPSSAPASASAAPQVSTAPPAPTCPPADPVSIKLSACEVQQIQHIVGPTGATADTLRVVRRYQTDLSVVTLISVASATSPYVVPDVLGQWLDQAREWINAHQQFEVTFEQSAAKMTFTGSSQNLGTPHYLLVTGDATLYDYMTGRAVGGTGQGYGITGYPSDGFKYSVTLLSPPNSALTDERNLTGAPATEACQLQVRSIVSPETEKTMRDRVAQANGSTQQADTAVLLLDSLGQEVLCNSFGLAAVDRWNGMGYPAYQLGDSTHVLSSPFTGVYTYPYVLPLTQAQYEALPVRTG